MQNRRQEIGVPQTLSLKPILSPRGDPDGTSAACPNSNRIVLAPTAFDCRTAKKVATLDLNLLIMSFKSRTIADEIRTACDAWILPTDQPFHRPKKMEHSSSLHEVVNRNGK
jgi:hypothetical protein